MNNIKFLFRLLIFAFASLLVLSCDENLIEDGGIDTPETKENIIHFTASYDDGQEGSTKVDIHIDEENKKAQVHFKAGDYILLWDGYHNAEDIYLKEENINADGSASFSTSMQSAGGKYYALAIDNKNQVFSSYGSGLGIYSSNGAYNDIAKGRIPHAAWAECSTEDPKLNFKNSFTLFKYYTVSDGAETVTITGNNNEDITGCIRFRKDGGKASLFNEADRKIYKSIVSRVTDWGEDCWFAMPPGITFEKGITLTVADGEGKTLSVVSSKKSFTTVAGKLWDLGVLEGSEMSPYEMWNAGYSIKINGVKYDKKHYGEAKLVKEGESASGAGVFFIEDEATAVPAGAGTVFYISNNFYKRAKLIVPEQTGTLQFTAPKMLVFNHIDIETPTDTLLFDDATTKGIDTLIIDDCKFTLHNGIMNRNSASKYLSVLSVTNSDFVIDIADDKMKNSFFINTGSTDEFTFKSITFNNNVFWSSKPREFHIIKSDGMVNSSATTPTERAKAVSAKKLYVDNNTFYDVDNSTFDVEWGSAYRPFFMLGTVSGDLSLNANLIYSTKPLEWRSDGTPVSDARVATILKCYFDTKSDNIRGKLASTSSWYGLDEKVCRLCICTDGSGSPAEVTDIRTGLNTLTEDPFELIDMAKGNYVQKYSYYGYGADR